MFSSACEVHLFHKIIDHYNLQILQLPAFSVASHSSYSPSSEYHVIFDVYIELAGFILEYEEFLPEINFRIDAARK